MFSLLLTGAVAVETENIVFSGVELPGVADEAFGVAPFGMARVGMKDLFNMTANGVSGLLTTRSSNKYFTRSSLVNAYVYYSGQFTHTAADVVTTTDLMRAGLCTYDQWNNIFNAEFYTYYKSGVAQKCSYIPKDSFKSGEQYYAFVKNLYPAGSISGFMRVVNYG